MIDFTAFAGFTDFVVFVREAGRHDVALPGRAGDAVEALLAKATQQGTDLLAELSRKAVKRLVSKGSMVGTGGRFFNDAELAELAGILARIHGTAGTLGRALIRDYQRRVQERHGEAPTILREKASDGLSGLFRTLGTTTLSLLEPEDALRYFRELVPTLGKDPQRHGQDLRRQAFTLAKATDLEILDRVQKALADLIQTGTAATRGERVINDLLDAAGVSRRSSGYAEMVVRTNVMDAYNQQATEELQDPDVIETFPVWMYSNPDDERSRPEHAARNGKYYPSTVAFVAVRGAGIEDAAQCRCVGIPVDKWEWKRLLSQGARLEMAA